MPVDFLADKSRQLLFRISTVADLPGFVKTASLDEQLDYSRVPPSKYASYLPRPSLPIHDRTATYLSAGYFSLQPGAWDNEKTVESRILKAAEDWGITSEVDALRASIWQHHRNNGLDLPKPTGISTEVFSKVAADVADDPRDPYPVRNGRETKAAADWILQTASKLSPTVRVEVARKTLDGLTKHAVDCHDFTRRKLVEFSQLEGGLTKTAAVEVISKIAAHSGRDLDVLKRSTAAAKESEVSETYPKMAGVLLGFVDDTTEEGLKLAREITAYSPDDKFFELADSSVWRQSELAKIAEDGWEALLGPKVVSECRTGFKLNLSKLASVAELLSPEKSMVVKNQLLQHGAESQDADDREMHMEELANILDL